MTKMEDVLLAISWKSPKRERRKINITPEGIANAIKVAGNLCTNDFIIDNENRHVFQTFAEYLTESPSFNKRETTINNRKNKFSLNKGILIVGNVGTGKTDAMRTLILLLRGFVIEQIKEVGSVRVAENTSVKGNEYLLTLYNGDLFIDDIGEEDDAPYYGTKINCVKRIITNRYTLWKKTGRKTYGTTNLNMELIAERYGERVVDRMYEMFNIVKLTGKTRRK